MNTTEYRIRPVRYATRLFGADRPVKTEWVVEQKRDRLPDVDEYQHDGWVQITSGITEIEAKKYFARWLNAEVSNAATAADFG